MPPEFSPALYLLQTNSAKRSLFYTDQRVCPPRCSSARSTGRKFTKLCPLLSSHCLYTMLKLSRTAWTWRTTKAEPLYDKAEISKPIWTNAANNFEKATYSSFQNTCDGPLWSFLGWNEPCSIATYAVFFGSKWTVYVISTQLERDRACIHPYLNFKHINCVALVDIQYCRCSCFLVDTGSSQNSFFLNFHCSFHAQIEYMQKRHSVWSVCHAFQSFLLAVGQEFVLRISFSDYHTIPIWTLFSYNYGLFHVLSIYNHVRCGALATHHPLKTPKLVSRSCHSLQI